MNQLTKKAALASTLLLLAFAAAFAAIPALAADPSFSLTGTPSKASYAIGDSATVQTKLTYNSLTAFKWIDMKLYNASGHYEALFGQIKAVAGTAGYTNTTTYNLPANTTAKVGSCTYTIKAIENTTKIVVATATIIINVADVNYVMSLAWQDSSGDRIITKSESVIFTVYVTYSNLATLQAVTLYVVIDAETPVTVIGGSFKAGSGTNTTTYSYTFGTEGLHNVEFRYLNASSIILASSLLQLTVGQPTTPTQGSLVDLITANAIPIAFGFGVVIVLLLFYIARKKR